MIYCVSTDYYQEINLVSEAVEKLDIALCIYHSQFKDLIYIPNNVTIKENLSYRDYKNYASSQYAIILLEDNDKTDFVFRINLLSTIYMVVRLLLLLALY